MPVPSYHVAKNVLVGCMDDRIVESHHNFIEKIGPAFCINMTGGGLSLVLPEMRKIARNQVVAAWKINHINHIYVESHLDCGMYKLSGITFNSPEEETERLYSDLDTAGGGLHNALLEAGVAEGEITITSRVVDTQGHLVLRQPEPQAAPTALRYHPSF